MSSKAGKRLVPALRFPEFTDNWQYRILGRYLEEYAERVNAGTELPIYSSTRTGLKPQKDYFDGKELINEGEYGVVPEGYFVYRHMSDDATFKFNINRTGSKIAVSKEYPVFRTVDLDSDFLLHKLNDGKDFKRFAIVQEKGGTRTRLYLKTLRAWNVLLPSLAEQTRIASSLSSLDDLITAQAKKVEALKAHKKGLMQQLFPAEGETMPRLRFPEFSERDGWSTSSLGDVCDVLQGYGFPDRLQGKLHGRYPFCKVSDISRAVGNAAGMLSTAANYIDEEELLELRAKVIPVGTTVFAKIGEALRLNRRAITTAPCLIDNNATGIKGKKGKAIDGFVFYLMKGIDLNEHCGGVVPSINKTTLEGITVTFPDLPEQRRIADCLSSVNATVTAHTQKLEALKVHKKGLMQGLFPAVVEGDA